MKSAESRVVRRAFVDSLPILMGYVTMGFVAGVLLAAKGGIHFAPLWAALTSGAVVSGTFNFAMVMPIAERMPLLSFAILTLGINFRYCFYGFTMLKRWRNVRGFKKYFLIHMLTDETYALEAAYTDPDEKLNLKYCLSLSAFDLLYWVVGVTSGAIAVAILEQAIDPEVIRAHTNGMEFAMVALFLVILTDQIRGFCKHAK